MPGKPEGGNKADTLITCRLCGNAAGAAAEVRLMGRHDVSLYLCPDCGLLQSEKPYWLEDAYSKAISRLDTGAVRRNLTLMRVAAVLLFLIGGKKGVYLDYGGGHGLFVRLMRDHGFDFRWSDRYGENLFASGFEYKEGTPLTGITAFEVLEHLEDPLAVVDELFSHEPDFILASTELFSEPVDPSWPYIYPENGQHIAFYQARTMRYIADKYGYHWTRWRFLHLFTKKPLPRLLEGVLFPLAWLLFPIFSPFLRARSLHLADHHRLSDGKNA